jgi:hypothetical protein
LGVQALALVAVAAYSAAASFVLLKAIALVTDLRPSAKAEGVGLDLTEHGEEGDAEVHPLRRVADRFGEDDRREHQDVLRPLLRAQCRERGQWRRAAPSYGIHVRVPSF